ncbi:CBS domain-containing protein [Azohydromonas caseinilytica]|uniref:CBS domain-containing protein n=1 Tax=Azohydromonas caseinilytica TaxID=2728836 RepID=A0A848F428_9BURK|nr:CBS domain-containing protein [Azohydromonas caseinilytica]NML13379.1 CBS domain-containing protein [Azohydromonas caseinilytica]
MDQVMDVMTRDVRVVQPTDTIERAAQLMDELNVGVVPVCEGRKLVGMLTDRDIAVRGVAAGMDAKSSPVSEIMSGSVRCCFEDQPLEDVLDEMRDTQIRRMPVVDRQQQIVGIVSLGDLADRGSDEASVGEALKDISTPAAPDRS